MYKYTYGHIWDTFVSTLVIDISHDEGSNPHEFHCLDMCARSQTEVELLCDTGFTTEAFGKAHVFCEALSRDISV